MGRLPAAATLIASLMSRQNVGGNQSGQQSGFVAHGAANNNVWSMDGAGITDPRRILRTISSVFLDLV